jgi:hypothetical protein
MPVRPKSQGAVREGFPGKDMKNENNEPEQLSDVQQNGVVDNPTVDKREENPAQRPSAPGNADANHPLAKLGAEFIHRVDEMRRAATIALPAINKYIKEKLAACTDIFEQYAEADKTADDKSISIMLPNDVRERVRIMGAIKEFDRIRRTKMLKIVERSLFIGLFSELDAFMGNLLTIIYTKQPALLKSIRREVSLTDLLQFESLDAVKQDMLDKEIDSFRRDSYIEQFSALENKFSFKTLRKFPEWSEFVEISQRRNLMTHNGGIVTEQYLSICAREGCKIEPDVVAGSQLKIGPEYYFRACHVLSLVAFMLVHTLWRKVLSNDAKEANEAIQHEVFEALRRKDWLLAVRMGEFSIAEEMRKSAEDIDIRIRHINLAIGYKKTNRIADMRSCLESCDWTASIRDFKLAVEILTDGYQAAADIMRQIGKTGELVRQDAYHDWPLFFDFIEREEFKAAYREIYGHDFDAKREDEPDAVTLDARGDNGSPLIAVERHKAIEIPPQSGQDGIAKKPERQRRKKAQE